MSFSPLEHAQTQARNLLLVQKQAELGDCAVERKAEAIVLFFVSLAFYDA